MIFMIAEHAAGMILAAGLIWIARLLRQALAATWTGGGGSDDPDRRDLKLRC